jgi:sugar transferase EpsL
MRYLERYSPEQARRNDAVPGITGWAQINGRNDLAWEDKFNLDVWYVDHCSFKLDISIIIKTFWKVFRREGISREGHFSSPEFMGTQIKKDPPQ